jgi:anti-sigma regulatory factor (Ser/Thr protein kinase)/anti-anti-sigma regulatory factor
LIWKILSGNEVTVLLPSKFNSWTMYEFIEQILTEQQDAKCSRVNFDFSKATFIEPVGVVVLSNLVEFLKKIGVKVYFKGHQARTGCTSFLDDSGFFEHYLKKRIFEGSGLRATTIPLKLIPQSEFTSYLYMKLMPWIGQEVGMSEHSLAALRTSLEEIFHNVNDHSGEGIGCTFAQHFPNQKRIQIAISDFGMGIPKTVRTKLPLLTDSEAIKKACEEGFTTQSNVRNRGAGLPNLMRYVTQRNNGTVLIASGQANVSAAKGINGTKVTGRSQNGIYPGTLVQVMLRTDTLEKSAADTELEPFEW